MGKVFSETSTILFSSVPKIMKDSSFSGSFNCYYIDSALVDQDKEVKEHLLLLTLTDLSLMLQMRMHNPDVTSVSSKRQQENDVFLRKQRKR